MQSPGLLRTVLATVVMPYLLVLGERCERGAASIAQEHFAPAVLRGRLLEAELGLDAEILGGDPVEEADRLTSHLETR